MFEESYMREKVNLNLRKDLNQTGDIVMNADFIQADLLQILICS